MFALTPPALPGGSNFPVEFVIASTAEAAAACSSSRSRSQMKAMESGLFYFPPIIDLKIDQPQSEIVIDHDKVATLGLNLAQVGADLASALGGNYVNRFNIAGRSYKVIPQIERSERLNPEQLRDIYITGPDGQAHPAQLDRDDRRQNGAALAQSLPAAQRGQDLRMPPASSTRRLKFLENDRARDSAAGLLDRLHGRVAAVPHEGGKFLPALAAFDRHDLPRARGAV